MRNREKGIICLLANLANLVNADFLHLPDLQHVMQMRSLVSLIYLCEKNLFVLIQALNKGHEKDLDYYLSDKNVIKTR